MLAATSTRGLPARRVVTPVLLALIFLVSLPAVTARIYASDEVLYFSFLRSVWFDHDLSFENEYQWFYDHGVSATPGFHETYLERTTETGLRLNFGTIGCALLWAPFYAVGDLVARGLHAAGRNVTVDGYSRPYVVAVAYGSALYGFLSVLLSAAIVRHMARWWPALATEDGLAALIVWLGTPLVFYMYIAPPMAHATSAFAVAAFLLCWLRIRDTWSVRGMALLGALAAVLAMVREQDAFFVVAPAIDFLWTLARRRDVRPVQAVSAAVVGAVVAGIVYLPQAWAYTALNGHVGPSHLVARKMTWSAPHALEVLVSPEHGFFLWTPLAFIAALGLVALAWRLAPEARIVLVGLIAAMALQVYVGGSVESWTVAGAFGQRRFVATTAVLTVGMAAVLAIGAEPRWRRWATTVVVVLAMWWNIALMVQFGAGWMDRQRLNLQAVAYNTFVAVPRALPGLAWRYLSDRSSFYQSRRAGTP
jgi:hypothetical protein